MAMYTRTAAGVTYILMKEDVKDKIVNISPHKTPLSSSLPSVPMNGSPHVVNIDALATRNADNAQREGADAPVASDTTPTQTSVYAQIISKTARCSGSLEARQIYGMGSQLAYQTANKMTECKNDLEAALVSSNATVAPAGATTAGKLAGAMNQISTNVDSTTTTFTSPTAFNTLLQQIYDAGGEPTAVYVGGDRKRDVSEKWTTNISRNEESKLSQLQEYVDIYLSDFGRMTFEYHWMMAATDCLILQMDMWALAIPAGRDWFIQDLAVTGDARRKQILWEGTLECQSELANGSFSALT